MQSIAILFCPHAFDAAKLLILRPVEHRIFSKARLGTTSAA
jgi:hypothetical protein